jgi:hypothetical protein
MLVKLAFYLYGVNIDRDALEQCAVENFWTEEGDNNRIMDIIIR